MNTKPTVSRFADRATLTVQPNTLAKADEEAHSFKFSTISSGHYTCESSDNTYILIDRDAKIGCSCDDMTYRCKENTVCKHIATFLKLDSPPQIPASGELIKKLMLMGWVGGKDDLHPAEMLKPVQNTPSEPTPTISPSVVCPHCKTRAKRKTQEEADAWLDKHVLGCQKNPSNIEQKAPPEREATAPKTEAPHQRSGALSGNALILDPTELKTERVGPPLVEIHPDEDSWAPDGGGCGMTLDVSPPPPNVPANLATALCNMQKVDLLAVTDSTNPFHNAKYADLASVWAVIRKPLTDNGLAVIQTTEQYPSGVTVVTTLVHVSGEAFSSRLSCEVPKSKPDKNGYIKPNIQGLGSTITYLRRYSIVAMVGVAPTDDDGEVAMSR